MQKSISNSTHIENLAKWFAKIQGNINSHLNIRFSFLFSWCSFVSLYSIFILSPVISHWLSDCPLSSVHVSIQLSVCHHILVLWVCKHVIFKLLAGISPNLQLNSNWTKTNWLDYEVKNEINYDIKYGQKSPLKKCIFLFSTAHHCKII